MVAHEDRLHDDRLDTVLLQGRHQAVVDLRRRVDHIHRELDAELGRRRLDAGNERLGILIPRPADERDRLAKTLSGPFNQAGPSPSNASRSSGTVSHATLLDV